MCLQLGGCVIIQTYRMYKNDAYMGDEIHVCVWVISSLLALEMVQFAREAGGETGGPGSLHHTLLNLHQSQDGQSNVPLCHHHHTIHTRSSTRKRITSHLGNDVTTAEIKTPRRGQNCIVYLGLVFKAKMFVLHVNVHDVQAKLELNSHHRNC